MVKVALVLTPFFRNVMTTFAVGVTALGAVARMAVKEFTTPLHVLGTKISDTDPAEKPGAAYLVPMTIVPAMPNCMNFVACNGVAGTPPEVTPLANTLFLVVSLALPPSETRSADDPEKTESYAETGAPLVRANAVPATAVTPTVQRCKMTDPVLTPAQ